MEEMSDVPRGFRFHPTDEELIVSYLVPKLNGTPLPCGIVTDKVVYGQNSTPWEIFDDEKDPWTQSKCKNKKTLYVFTQLKKKSKGKKQIERTAGCGTWDGQTAPRIVKDGHGKVVGFKKYFSFEPKSNDNIRTHGHWGMHEFSVSDGGGEYVLCAITRDDSKRIEKTPLVVVHQSNSSEEAAASGSIHQEPLEVLQVATEFDPKLFKDDDTTAPLQVQNEVLDQRNAAFGNWTESQGPTTTVIEYQGSTIEDYGQFTANNRMDDDMFDVSFLDGISLDQVPEPLLWENQCVDK